MNTSLQRFRQWNDKPSVGYLTRLVLFELEQVISIEPVGMEVTSSGIMLVAGAKGVLFEFSQKVCTWQETKVDDEVGELYTENIEMQVYGQNKALLSWLYANQARRFIGFWRDTNGECFMAGNKDNGLRYQYRRAITDRSMIQVSIAGKFTQPSYFLDSSFINTVQFQQF
ncbi:hypothetical protein VB264_16770 [Arcicella aquatica]|uniref:Uncharacterized protein n=1 Tax=Arcicella aquatica TaxID=217141 RepID=A0ABU5QQU2_9BACT|nr:hypothetical protein [Arcicella aquatica]MEA5259455.1 hypothetical protein [Arcicella aquatica]